MIVYSNEINNNLIVSIDAGNHFSGYLTEQGEAYTFGSNSQGQLGIGDENIQQVSEPHKMDLDNFEVIK